MTDVAAMEAESESGGSPDVFHGVPAELLRSDKEKQGPSPLKRGLDKVQPLPPNHHHFALHMGCCNAPKNPGCVTARVRNMGESLESQNKTLHQLVQAASRKRKQAKASGSKRKQAQASAS